MTGLPLRRSVLATSSLLLWMLVTARLVILQNLVDPSSPTIEVLSRNFGGHRGSDASLSVTRYDAIHTCQVRNITYTFPKTPSFAIIGVQKAGTTALASYLTDHPNVVDTKKPGREPHFFDNSFRGMKDWYQRGRYASREEFYCDARQRYVNWFFDTNTLMEAVANGTKVVSFDKTPSYLHLANASQDLQESCPWLQKVIVILRNPVDRAYSNYRMNLVDSTNKRSWGSFEHHINDELKQMHQVGLIGEPSLIPDKPKFVTLNMSQEEEVDRFAMLNGPPLLRKGMYAIQLLQWLKRFSYPDQLLVLKFDDLQNDARTLYQRVLRHVGLPKYDVPGGYKPLYKGRYPPMRNKTREFLTEFFAPYNVRLGHLLGDEWKDVWA
jgi:hypothetical protein